MPLFPDLNSLVSPLLILVNTAGQRISEFYSQETQVFRKQDGSPVTLADQQSHLILKEGLEKLLPTVPVISEEDSSSWSSHTKFYWLVDPLDGTSGFIQKTGEFCINIALLEDARPIFGLIHLPLTHETFYGYQGNAWRHLEGRTILIHARPVPSEGMTLLVGGDGHKHKAQENAFLASYPIAERKVVRSAIKFCSIAAGHADIYLRLEECSEWDTAAGQALVEAAGGGMVNLDGSPFIYEKPNLRNGAFVVAGNKHDLPPHS